jgi:hypothetical protein
VVTRNVRFRLSTSVDGGYSWVFQGTLIVSAGKRTGILDYIVTDPIIRIMLLSTSEVSPYVINDIVLKVVLRGTEHEE